MTGNILYKYPSSMPCVTRGLIHQRLGTGFRKRGSKVRSTANSSVRVVLMHSLDWRLAKPKMHVIGCEDPSPNDPDYGESVVCEHGGLLPNLAVRRRISPEVSWR